MFTDSIIVILILGGTDYRESTGNIGRHTYSKCIGYETLWALVDTSVSEEELVGCTGTVRITRSPDKVPSLVTSEALVRGWSITASTSRITPITCSSSGQILIGFTDSL